MRRRRMGAVRRQGSQDAKTKRILATRSALAGRSHTPSSRHTRRPRDRNRTLGTGVPAQPHLLGRRRVAEHRSLSTARHDVDTKIYRRLTCVPDRLHSCQGAPPVRIVRTLVYRNGYRQPENLDWKYWRNRCGGSTSRTAMTPMQATFTAQLGV